MMIFDNVDDDDDDDKKPPHVQRLKVTTNIIGIEPSEDVDLKITYGVAISYIETYVKGFPHNIVKLIRKDILLGKWIKDILDGLESRQIGVNSIENGRLNTDRVLILQKFPDLITMKDAIVEDKKETHSQQAITPP